MIDTPKHFLYLVEADGKAMRYGIGVGRPGFTWAGEHKVSAKKEWPDWVPPPEMLERQPGLPHFMAGGPDNPLGARALYLGSTLYRIHGSNEPWTIGHQVSSGCIRLRNEDVIDLYSRVKVGAKVVVTRDRASRRATTPRCARAGAENRRTEIRVFALAQDGERVEPLELGIDKAGMAHDQPAVRQAVEKARKSSREVGARRKAVAAGESRIGARCRAGAPFGESGR